MDLVEVLGFLFMLSTMELERVRISSRASAQVVNVRSRSMQPKTSVRPRKPCLTTFVITDSYGRGR